MTHPIKQATKDVALIVRAVRTSFKTYNPAGACFAQAEEAYDVAAEEAVASLESPRLASAAFALSDALLALAAGIRAAGTAL